MTTAFSFDLKLSQKKLSSKAETIRKSYSPKMAAKSIVDEGLLGYRVMLGKVITSLNLRNDRSLLFWENIWFFFLLEWVDESGCEYEVT